GRLAIGLRQVVQERLIFLGASSVRAQDITINEIVQALPKSAQSTPHHQRSANLPAKARLVNLFDAFYIVYALPVEVDEHAKRLIGRISGPLSRHRDWSSSHV